jgi:hypothetical protein
MRTGSSRKPLLTRIALTAALAASLTFAMQGAAMAAGPARPGPLAPAEKAASALMRAQLPLVRAADTIRTAGTKGRSGYTNVTISVPQHLVTVYWKGAVPAQMARLLSGLRSASVHIAVRPSRYTARQMTAELRRLEASRARYAARGLFLDAFRPRVNGTGITVSISARTGFRHAMTAARASLRAGSPIPLRFGHLSKLTPAHRLEDLPLHWAGARIINVQGNDSCTTGFPMQRTSDGRTFITTADHCDSNDGHQVNEQWWDWIGPHDTNHRMGEAWYHTAPLDIAYIRPPNGWVAGITYDGGVAESNDFSKNVVGVGGNLTGAYVCSSGSWTGVHCSIKTLGGEVVWIPEDNSYVSLWVGNQTAGATAAGEGDSGGPVFSLGGAPYTVIAKGSLTGGIGNGYTCTNDNGESTTCFTEIAWVDEQSILNGLGATILTT